MNRRFVIGLSLLIDVVILDQVTKWFVMKTSPALAGDVLFLHLGLQWTLNPHFAFSIPAPWYVIAGVVAIVLALVVRRWWFESSAGFASSYGLALVVGGALGNAIDRVRLGGVQDWLEIGIRTWSTASFNVADVVIIIGVLWWVYLAKDQPASSSVL